MTVKEHVCPSNVVWVKYEGQEKYHNVQRAWLDSPYHPDYPSDGPQLPTDKVRSDGMVYNRLRTKARCGLEVKDLVQEKYHILMDEDEACPACWAVRY